MIHPFVTCPHDSDGPDGRGDEYDEHRDGEDLPAQDGALVQQGHLLQAGTCLLSSPRSL